MKKILLFFILISCINFAYSQGIQNSIVGIYTGTYIDYDTGPDFDTLVAGVRITALPGDTAGIILHDTLNNLVDTMYIFLDIDINSPSESDTFLYFPPFLPCGDIYPANDSIEYSRCYGVNGNPVSESSIKCVQHFFSTDIIENAKPKIVVFPNPVSDYLTIKSEYNTFYFSLFNILGQEIKSGEITNSTQISLANYSSGIYYIKLVFENNATILRIIKN